MSVRGHYWRQPATLKTQIMHFFNMAESLSSAAFHVAVDPCLDSIDTLIFRLEGALTAARQFRKNFIAASDPGLERD